MQLLLSLIGLGLRLTNHVLQSLLFCHTQLAATRAETNEITSHREAVQTQTDANCERIE